MTLDEIRLHDTADALRVLYQYLFEEDSSIQKREVYKAFKVAFVEQRMATDLAMLWEHTEDDLK